MAVKKRAKLSPAVEKVDDQVSDLWRTVDLLMTEIVKKTDYVARLREHNQTPLMMSDTPVIAWQAMCQTYAAIGALKELRSNLILAEQKRGEATKKPRARDKRSKVGKSK